MIVVVVVVVAVFQRSMSTFFSNFRDVPALIFTAGVGNSVGMNCTSHPSVEQMIFFAHKTCARFCQLILMELGQADHAADGFVPRIDGFYRGRYSFSIGIFEYRHILYKYMSIGNKNVL